MKNSYKYFTLFDSKFQLFRNNKFFIFFRIIYKIENFINQKKKLK